MSDVPVHEALAADINWDLTSAHAWRWPHHVPEAIQALWPTFTPEQKIAIHDWAVEIMKDCDAQEAMAEGRDDWRS